MYSAMAEKDKEEGKAEEQKGEDAEKKGDAERANDGGEEQKTEEKEEKDIKPQAVDEEQKKAEGEAEEKSESDAKPAQNDELKDKKEEDAADETEEAIGAFFFFLNINEVFLFCFFFSTFNGMFSDGEEEVDGEDAEMEDDGEEQGEGDEAAEKVFDQICSSDVRKIRADQTVGFCTFVLPKESGEDEEAEGEEVGNLQLAWEMLEVAKVIYKRCGDGL